MLRTFFILAAIITLIKSCGSSGEGPELLWLYQGLGRGYGGPLVTHEGIYINGEEEGNSFTCCLDHKGNLRWKSPNGKTFTGFDFSASYPGTRSIPSLKGNYLYAISGMGHVSCFQNNTGKVIWSVDLVKDFQGKPGDFGYSESPVVDENRVYCFTGGQVHNMLALDRYSGHLLWSSPVKRDSFAYGSLLSSYPLEAIRYGFEHCNSVVFRDGYIYFVASEEQGQGTVKLHLSEDGESLTEVWRNENIMNVFEGFVIKANLLYTTLENKKLVVLDTENGNIVLTDNKLFIYGHNGNVQLFSLNRDQPELISEMRISTGNGHHFSFPVISDGRMYIRRGNTLMAFSLEN